MTNDSGRGIEEIEFSRSTPRREVQKYKLPGRYNKRHRVRGRDEEVASTLKNDFSSRFFIPIVPLNYSHLSTSITRYSIFGFFENSRRGSHAKKSAGHDFIKLSSLDSARPSLNRVRHCASPGPIRRVRNGNKESRGGGFRSARTEESVSESVTCFAVLFERGVHGCCP